MVIIYYTEQNKRQAQTTALYTIKQVTYLVKPQVPWPLIKTDMKGEKIREEKMTWFLVEIESDADFFLRPRPSTVSCLAWETSLTILTN